VPVFLAYVNVSKENTSIGPEDGGSMFIRNTGMQVTYDMVQQPRSPPSLTRYLTEGFNQKR
jgi:hypothetical protein